MSESTETQNFWADAEVIHTYTRAQGIADGVLVDVTETAREAGFKFPVALTSALYFDAVAWNEDNIASQDIEGRLWDVLSMAYFAIRGTRDRNTDRITASVLRIPNKARCTVPRKLTFTVHIGPGDTPEPVMTFMLPHES